MHLRSIVVSFVAAISLAGTAFAQGTGRELDIQPGARQNGLGAAGVALADDATGVTWWNPAGLGFVNRAAVEMTYAQLVPDLAPDVNYNYLTYVQPVEGWGAFGIGVVFVSLGQIDQTDVNGTQLGTFGSNAFVPGIYYGTRLLPDFSVGAALRYVRLQYAPNSLSGVGTTFAMDLAGLYRIPAARLSFGANVQNLGPSITFLNEDAASPLSRNIKVGAAWEAYASDQLGVTIVEDFNQSLVTSPIRTYNHGLEVRVAQQLAGRLGWYSDPYGHISDLTFGLGVSWGGLNFDFGSVPQAEGLEHVKKITLGYRF
jgi:hypothetical protein